MTDLCLRDALELLKNQGHTNTTATRVHHAILAGHISRPEMDGSHRYRFSRRNLNELRWHGLFLAGHGLSRDR